MSKKRVVFLLIIAVLLYGLPSFALKLPLLKSRVNDYASILSPSTEQQLESILTSLELEEATQLTVLTISSLQGENLEEFSLKVAEQWRLGQKGLDNGGMLLIAVKDRKIRIEVGYGLEGSLTDLVAGRIIRDIITPQFRNSNFNQGVIDGVTAMIATVKGEFDEKNFVNASQTPDDEIAGLLIFLVFALFNIGRMFGKQRILAGGIGAILCPVLASIFFNFGWLIIAAFIPVGFVAGYLATILFRPSVSSRRSISSGGGSGGFSSGGGGFSGGGGGFGGGGSSGGW